LFDHENLNPSQRRAVELCSRSNVAFVWGPPGTGKTTTLSHIVLELLSKRQRILIAATTNAALDRALSHLVRQTEIRQLVDAGGIVRVGNSEAETFGTALYEVRQRVGERQERALARARHRERDRRTRLGACANLLELLAMSENRQQNLFGEKPEELPYFDWLAIDRGAERRWRRLKHAAKVRASTRRRDRLTKLCRLYADRTRRLTAGLERVEAGIVRDARVILSTLTNTYFSTLLAAERFDVLIVEEAGMAILPNLFYAASLAHGATIMVGDPKQLPAIVQSKDPYVRRAMGRNIFDVAISDPHSSEIVAMLTTQYRMHPLIGTLVSTSFYDGRVENGPVPDHVLQMAGREPFPGTALVVVDTSGHSNAESAAGGSRCNENAAELAAVLAVRARKQCAGRIAVITPYAAQSRKIRQLLRARQEPSIECSTVHRFQGHECDVVILDTTDAEPLRPGVLLTETGKGAAARHLINVSISRARAKLVIIADVQYFRTRAPDAPITNVLCVAGKLGHTVRFEDVN
jgi:superfamily I DNA and/or RNA helicase